MLLLSMADSRPRSQPSDQPGAGQFDAGVGRPLAKYQSVIISKHLLIIYSK